ncbi:hypothetical protein LTR91_016974 [Friedmanniomyces endolithicus]|uniref:Uncharacterized protein n=1 Tax=Friedmanniomyces endolithicus TaxID=329885 RepID=A0AAN6K743_9PEZI|nr:hypothetical protein LTR87_005382 [Friedmanniomyces endolithicus]KAK0906040.1 hypothetical protein LTR57_018026 [Friedmanniomyces endolithicus]KAK0967919.1 hypothetical protein LTR91_016974 [Friedmanniomyces endolithicus]KAK1033452.1 hypothetical protein LTS16_016333 [Friedmanniomyces endolithicus]KAK1086457.1 hypothetical protein LTR33_001561 [Friedmanniomyces endolithicus]
MFPITLAIAALAFLATFTMAAPPMESPNYSAPEFETFSKSTASYTESAYGTSGVATPTGGPASHRQPHPSTFTTSHSEYSSFAGASYHLPEGAPTVAMPTFPAKDLAEAPAEALVSADDAIFPNNGILIDPLGFIHVADDGVERSYAANGTVIDYRRLSNDQLTRIAATLPTEMMDVWKGVDGNDVTSESQIYAPAPALRPTAPTAEDLQQSVNEVAAMKKVLEGRAVGPAIGYPSVPPLCTTLSCYRHMTCQMFGCNWCWLSGASDKGRCVFWA